MSRQVDSRGVVTCADAFSGVLCLCCISLSGSVRECLSALGVGPQHPLGDHGGKQGGVLRNYFVGCQGG